MNGSRHFVNGSDGQNRRSWTLRVGLVLCTGLLLWRLGPFGTFGDLAAGQRFAYSVGLTMLMWLQCVVALSVLRHARFTTRFPEFALIVLAALAGAAPTAFEVAWAEMVLRVQRDLGPVDLLAIYADVALLAVPLLMLTHGVIGRPARDESSPITDAQPQVDIVGQLPPSKRGRLVALASQDHYVRIHTDRGQHLVHMRFNDALAAMAESAGCQVHRGWWVARGAGVAEHKDGDRSLIELADGTRVPVSRTYVRAARAAGLIG